WRHHPASRIHGYDGHVITEVPVRGQVLLEVPEGVGLNIKNILWGNWAWVRIDAFLQLSEVFDELFGLATDCIALRVGRSSAVEFGFQVLHPVFECRFFSTLSGH